MLNQLFTQYNQKIQYQVYNKNNPLKQMDRCQLNFENIPKRFINKKYSNLFNPSVVKPQFQWLHNYLRLSQPKPSKTPAEPENQKLSKRSITKRRLKTRQKVIVVNENKNLMNIPKFGIYSKFTERGQKKVEESNLDHLDFDNQTHTRRNSCQLLKTTQSIKFNKMRMSKQDISKKRIKLCNKQRGLLSTLEPWQSQQLMTEKSTHDIIQYMFDQEQ